MTGKRKRYGADFKAKVALEALKGELTLSQLAAKHGVHQTMIAAWRKQAVEGLGRRLQKGQSFLREIPDDVVGGGVARSSIEQAEAD